MIKYVNRFLLIGSSSATVSFDTSSTRCRTRGVLLEAELSKSAVCFGVSMLTVVGRALLTGGTAAYGLRAATGTAGRTCGLKGTDV